MFSKLTTIYLFLLIISSLTLKVSASTSCNATNLCPEDSPCCSQYGVCGVGSYCLGGCNPLWSYNLSACMPSPVCQDVDTEFTSVNQFTSINKYLGDASKSDWIYDGTILEYEDSIILAMPAKSGGTVVSSSRFVWYGKIDVTLKSSHLAGVVTAFILFSNVQDEIDYENVGVDLYKWQTNYYYQGVLNWTHSKNISTNDSTFDNYHTLSVDWKEDQIEFSVNGVSGRVLKKEDTWNETSQSYWYPQTPSRVQISLWPGGAAADIGTVEWAGGAIDWDASDLSDPGYYYAFIKSAKITCYDPPSGTVINGNSSYIYVNSNANQSDVQITNNKTYLGSFDDTGFNPNNDKNRSSNSTKTASASASSVPTGLGDGAHGSSSSDDDDDDDSQADSGNDDSSSYTYTGNGFVQFVSSTASGASSVSKGGAMASITINLRQLLTFLALSISVVVTLSLM